MSWFLRIVLATLAAGSLSAQSTVVLSGRITNAVTDQGIEGAIVNLTQGSGRDVTVHTRYTDAGGNYTFEDAVSGAGQVELRASGYVAFLATNSDDASIQITADHAQQNFKLMPTASITGRIINREEDAPGWSIAATLLREDYTDGVKRFVLVAAGSSGHARIGPDGSFGFAGLEPGSYIVSAGRSGQEYGNSLSPIRTELATKNGPAEGYAVTFYPGTTDFADALPVTLAGGDARSVDFRIAKRALFRVSGEIGSSGGEASRALMSISRNNGGMAEVVFGGFVTIPGPFAVSGSPPDNTRWG